MQDRGQAGVELQPLLEDRDQHVDADRDPDLRRALDDLRGTGVIGDDAYRLVEGELDWLELSARLASPPG